MSVLIFFFFPLIVEKGWFCILSRCKPLTWAPDFTSSGTLNSCLFPFLSITLDAPHLLHTSQLTDLHRSFSLNKYIILNLLLLGVLSRKIKAKASLLFPLKVLSPYFLPLFQVTKTWGVSSFARKPPSLHQALLVTPSLVLIALC